ncbi:iron chaperone [Flavilitoribacter nigricans]|uniref:YdhG-like domain-containing protein n=1 Tax=Flavilitoribacter nigricans (strain ATCC 23147 / DSM 23189 / NBRC 102662 / NCIMB 1420 / SS-2) TaxID=1122177 RepID=A0A2D0N9K0_FLAN2|nr:DUF1801 domain-containing protein [Flavilitoribacter nigricans]PHN05194.1 hypothetical protein CRP01_16885 [Flavilitoribacter nigricans DSM 23189 = NBRC 102662]
MEEQHRTQLEDYFLSAPAAAQEKLQELRDILRGVAPSARELLKWGKPAFESNTILFAYAAHKAHLSFIPTGPALEPFKKELSGYTVKKDSVQFPYDQPLPGELIRKIAQYRKEDVEERGAKWKY